VGRRVSGVKPGVNQSSYCARAGAGAGGGEEGSPLDVVGPALCPHLGRILGKRMDFSRSFLPLTEAMFDEASQTPAAAAAVML